MEEYEYSNPRYRSYVNDFNDEYHEPEREVNWISKDTISNLKQIKRRYRDFGEYCDAMTLINRYLDDLVDRYGGKKRFKLLLQLEMVKEYLPILPVLRRTKKNRRFIDGNESREYTEKADMREAIKAIKVKEFDSLKIDFGFTKKIQDGLMDKIKDNLLKDKSGRMVAAELDTIEAFYQARVRRPTKKQKKKMKKKILKRRNNFNQEEYYSMDQRIDDYYWRKDNNIDDSYDPNEVINYKGTTYRRSEADEIEVADQLKELGIDLGMRQLSKHTRKVVKRKNKKLKKSSKTKKKEEKMRKTYMKMFSDGKYQTFKDFENEVRDFARD